MEKPSFPLAIPGLNSRHFLVRQKLIHRSGQNIVAVRCGVDAIPEEEII
jgi:hypothetical protein